MTDVRDRLDTLVEALGAATPSPWVDHGNGMIVATEADTDNMLVHGYVAETPYTVSSDARLICALRNVAPLLVVVARRAERIAADCENPRALPQHAGRTIYEPCGTCRVCALRRALDALGDAIGEALREGEAPKGAEGAA